MSPAEALIYVENIRAALAEADPANAESMRRMRRNIPRRSRRRRADPRNAGGDPEERRWLVTSEGAFSYLARDFGMNEIYIWPMNEDRSGHAAAGAPGDRPDPGARGAGDLFRIDRRSAPGRAGRPRDRHPLRRRALRRQPEPAGAGRCRAIST
jgi:hypothetical protein